MMRLSYKNTRSRKCDFRDAGPDQIGFDIVSDELDARNRDSLRARLEPTIPIEERPGIVRPGWKRHFCSLWEAM